MARDLSTITAERALIDSLIVLTRGLTDGPVAALNDADAHIALAKRLGSGLSVHQLSRMKDFFNAALVLRPPDSGELPF